MHTFAPSYYKKFHCIADKCKHSCCIGWEIDIDEDTYSLYNNHTGILKKRFEAHISDGEPRHFILGKNERCPFLNNKNLCDIYTEMGEKSLCRICTDHPRFRNFYEDCTEIGIGLCCEEACRIILSNNDSFALECLDDCDKVPCYTLDENELILFRNEVIQVLQNRTMSIYDRFDDVWQMLGIKVAHINLPDIFSGLEYMEHDISSMVSENHVYLPDIYLEQLAVYFIYRHLTDSFSDGMTAERIIFAYIGVKAICAMCNSLDFEDICEAARIYSSEIEYSEENVEEILYRVGDLIEILI